MELKEKAEKLVCIMKEAYPDACCSLDWNENETWRLLVAARLSAQCTDKRVNIVTEELFSVYPTLNALAGAPAEHIMDIVRPCGLYRVKGQNIKDMCMILRDRFGGRVPDTMEELLSLPGVGRKIANLILGDVFHKPAIVADTHCIRLSNRMGLCDSKDPHKVEKQLKALIAPEEQNDFCHRLVYHGRAVCTARSPQCSRCTAAAYCDEAARIAAGQADK